MIGPVEMGALLKKIRLSKNLTLKELASDYLSVSFFYSKYTILGAFSKIFFNGQMNFSPIKKAHP